MMKISNNSKKSKLIFLLLFAAVFGQAYAQLQLSKHSINNGSDVMTGGAYELKSSIGQVDADNPSAGSFYNLNGGFWQQNNDLIFKNNFL